MKDLLFGSIDSVPWFSTLNKRDRPAAIEPVLNVSRELNFGRTTRKYSL